MSKKYNYNQLMNIKYEHHEVIDVPQIVKECTDKWFNQTLTKVNDSVVRIGVFEEGVAGGAASCGNCGKRGLR